jgi:pyruvate,water dikinase
MNVVVMEMIDSFRAGVIFSVDPSTRNNTVLIEAVEGLGENLVSGITQANEYFINKETKEIIENELLSKESLEELFESTLIIEQNYKSPVDIEWAMDKDNNIYYLQLRPITTLDDPTIDELNTTYKVDKDVITNHNVGEMLPGAITPLTLSTVVYSIDFGLRKMLKKIGLFKKIEDCPSEFLVSHYYNHLFFNMKYLYRISKSVLGASKEAVDMGLCGRELEISQTDDFKKRSILYRSINGIKYAKYMTGYKKALIDVVNIESKIKFDNTTITSLYDSITSNIIYLNQVLEDHYIVSSHSGAMSSAVFMFLNADIKDKDIAKAKVAYVLEDIDDIESVDILRSMRLICSTLIDEYPNYNDFDLSTLEAILQKENTNTNLAYIKFIQKHGHRCIKESELRNKAWKDDLSSLTSYIKSILPTIKTYKEKEESNIDNKISEVTKPYKGIKKKILNYLINQARLGCKNREYSKSKMILVVDKFKHAYQDLALKLVENDILPNSDLIYFLTHQEIDNLINKKDYTLIRKAMVRRNLIKDQENLEFNHVNLGIPKPIEQIEFNVVDGEIIQGTSLSRGSATGKARVVRTLEDARLLKQGEIMVAGYTDIGWSPYFSLISGLITEVGSALSHGAVVAREYGLPLVSNVRFATNKIKTGDIILIDGTKGTVSIIESI